MLTLAYADLGRGRAPAAALVLDGGLDKGLLQVINRALHEEADVTTYHLGRTAAGAGPGQMGPAVDTEFRRPRLIGPILDRHAGGVVIVVASGPILDLGDYTRRPPTGKVILLRTDGTPPTADGWPVRIPYPPGSDPAAAVRAILTHLSPTTP